MAAPTYRCPFKNDGAGSQGMQCEATNCAGYDGDAEHCSIVEYVQRQLVINGKTSPNNS